MTDEMIPIEDIDMTALRVAIKTLNDSGHLEKKLKAIGKKEVLIDNFAEAVDSIDLEIRLPELVTTFYNHIFQLDVEETKEETKEPPPSDPVEEPEPEEILEETPEEPEETPIEETPAIQEAVGLYKKDLLDKILGLLNPIFAKASTIAEFLSFTFTGTEIAAFNGEMFMFYPFFTDFECMINADDFSQLISKMTGDVTLEFKDGALRVGSDNIKAGLFSVSPGLGFNLKELIADAKKDPDWQDLPPKFLDGLNLVHYAASKDGPGTSNCVFVGENQIVATDGSRLSSFEIEEAPEFLIRAKTIKHLLSAKPDKIGLTDNWAYFTSDEIGVTCGINRISGNFVDHDSVLSTELSMSFPVPTDLKRIVDLIRVLSDKKDKTIEITIEDKKLTCSCDSDRGWAEETIFVEAEGEVNFLINPDFLSQALIGEMDIGYSDALVILSKPGFRHAIALKAKG